MMFVVSRFWIYLSWPGVLGLMRNFGKSWPSGRAGFVFIRRARGRDLWMRVERRGLTRAGLFA